MTADAIQAAAERARAVQPLWQALGVRPLRLSLNGKPAYDKLPDVNATLSAKKRCASLIGQLWSPISP